jgi:hypothetical protein
VLAKNLLTERFAFYELDGFYSANPAGSQREAADAAEGVNHPQGHCWLSRGEGWSILADLVLMQPHQQLPGVWRQSDAIR